MSVPARVRRLVFDRDGERCVHCGTTEGLTIQHRANRGMGGSKTLDGPENLIAMCALANFRLEQDSAFADLGRIYGWKIRRSEDPTAIPVLYPDGNHYSLTTRGTRIKENTNG